MDRRIRRSRFEEISIPKNAIRRICAETAQQYLPNCRFPAKSSTVVQTALEDYLIQLFADAHLCTLHRNRKTLTTKDIELVLKLRHSSVWSNNMSLTYGSIGRYLCYLYSIWYFVICFCKCEFFWNTNLFNNRKMFSILV